MRDSYSFPGSGAASRLREYTNGPGGPPSQPARHAALSAATIPAIAACAAASRAIGTRGAEHDT
jgi:hypothetical protein